MFKIGGLFTKFLAAPTFTVIVTGISGVIAFLLGTWTPLLTALLVVQLCDIFTGIMVGKKKKEVYSETFFEGLGRKVGMWIMLILANIMDITFLGGVPVCKSAISGALVAGEGLSLVENLGLLGVPIPTKITEFLKQIQDENSEKDFMSHKKDKD